MKTFRTVLAVVGSYALFWLVLAGGGALVFGPGMGSREWWAQAGPLAKLAVVALFFGLAYLVGRLLGGRRHEQDGPPQGNEPWK